MGLFALATLWGGAGPEQIARTLVDALVNMLDVHIVFIRFYTNGDAETLEWVKVGPGRELTNQPENAAVALRRELGDDPGAWPSRVCRRVAGTDLAIVTLRLDVQGSIGVLVAASERTDFPQDTETLLLNVAATQAVIALQNARLLDKQTRRAATLDQRVAQHTSQLE